MRRLGKGLKDLFGGAEAGPIVEVDVNAITPNPYQPRTDTEEGISELVESIKKDGVLQPIVVRPFGEGFQLVFGERRWRASIKAGLSKVPALVKDVDEEGLLRFALIENMQRRDLNPIAKARAIKTYMERYGYTQAEVAEKLRLSRSTVANTLRLLALPQNLKRKLERGEISPSSVRYAATTHKTAVRRTSKETALKELEAELRAVSDWALTISGTPYAGRITIRYKSKKDLMRLCEVLKKAFVSGG